MSFKLLLAVTATFLITSCNRISEDELAAPVVDAAFQPYEVSFVSEVMQEEGVLSAGTTIAPTHRYVSLHAETEAALLALQNSGLLITPFSIATGKKGDNGTFYALLPSEKIISPAVEISTIADLYIPTQEERSLEKKLLEKAGYLNAEESAAMRETAITIQGQVNVQYPENNTFRPVRNAKIVAIENGRQVEGQLDNEGRFSITGDFFKRIDLYVVFENDVVKITRIAKRNLLEVFFPAWQKVGSFPKASWGNVQVNIPLSRNEPWSLLTIHNSIYEYYDFCDAFGYKKPEHKLVLWAAENYMFSASYSAPMLNHLDLSSREYIADILQGMLGVDRDMAVQLSNLANVGLPDIFGHYFTESPSTRLRKTMYHELTHASHFAQIGPQFWTRYIDYIIKNGGYGSSNSPNNGIVAYSEGWADDISYEALKYTFGSYLSYNTEAIAVEWIIYGLYYDLLDNSMDTADAVSGIQFRQVYDLFTPNIDSPEALKETLKANLTGPNATPEAIDALFGRHNH